MTKYNYKVRVLIQVTHTIAAEDRQSACNAAVIKTYDLVKSPHDVIEVDAYLGIDCTTGLPISAE